MTQESPQCAWTGVEEDGETVVDCDKPARSIVHDRHGHAFYACDEHLAFVEARAGSGAKEAIRPRASRPPQSPQVHVVLA